nr:retrovirus-related Pol polyprotein from transposon TNT 1-94 [Tanacetum cinerariifolium]
LVKGVFVWQPRRSVCLAAKTAAANIGVLVGLPKAASIGLLVGLPKTASIGVLVGLPKTASIGVLVGLPKTASKGVLVGLPRQRHQGVSVWAAESGSSKGGVWFSSAETGAFVSRDSSPKQAHLESSTSNAQDACNAGAPESSGNSNPTATSTNAPADHMETLTVESLIPTVSSPVLTACLDDSPEPSSDTRLISKRFICQDDTPSLNNILSLSNRFEDILGVTTNIDDSNGVEANLGNMEYSISANPTPTFRIHKDHPKSQIIGPVDTPVQTRTKVRPIGTKWVFKNKKDERGIVIKNKARLVAQGHTQEEGIDYKEVFAPVARIEAIRLFLAYASFMGFTVYQMDVKSAFLYGTIDEEVYVMKPPGFQDPEFPARVYKVEKAMYGLHQAPRAWYEFEALMHEKFQMSAMGELNFFLGLQVLQKKDVIFLSQDKYVGDILKKLGYSEVRLANTPMDKENPWEKDGTGKEVDLHLYRSMIGSLMYLTTSRPDIMFAVCACARHQVTPKECHVYAVKRIFRYLKSHPKLGIWYPKDSPFDLVAYSDSDYGGATQDRKINYWRVSVFG